MVSSSLGTRPATPSSFCRSTNTPIGQAETYAVAVYAYRYGICTGWHRFRLGDDSEIALLGPWLRRRQFRDRRSRRDFQLRHPECCIRRPTPRRCLAKMCTGDWPPYFPDDPKPPA